jgi:hypothetical protein
MLQSLRHCLKERTCGALSLPLALGDVFGTDSEASEKGLLVSGWCLAYWSLSSF